jgi:ribonuclease E
MAIEVTRILMLASQHQGVARINVRVNENVAAYLNNRKRRELIQLEESSGVAILILGSDSQFPEFLEIDCRDKDNGIVTVPFVLSQ